MEPSKYDKLSTQILDYSTDRWCEIYKITCLTTKKIYIGQAVSHILSHKKYRPYGREGRFKSHISEAFSNKKKQSFYLNSAIKKYGIEDFTVDLIENCEIPEADTREIYYINELESLFPKGFNLKTGGKQGIPTEEYKKRVSAGVEKYFKNRKFDRFKNITKIDDDIEKYIKPLNRDGKQYGYYVRINGCKADFGGVHIPIETSKNNAIEFIETLKNNLKTN